MTLERVSACKLVALKQARFNLTYKIITFSTIVFSMSMQANSDASAFFALDSHSAMFTYTLASTFFTMGLLTSMLAYAASSAVSAEFFFSSMMAKTASSTFFALRL